MTGGRSTAPIRGEAAPDGLAGMALQAREPTNSTPMSLAQAAQQRIASDATQQGSPEWALPLIVAGLTMAASRKPGLMQAAAEGGIAGIAQMMTGRRERRFDEKEARAEAREDRTSRNQDRSLDLQERAAQDLARYRDRSTMLDERRLETDEQYNNERLKLARAAAGRGSTRAPSRTEHLDRIYGAVLSAGGTPDDALAAVNDVRQAYYGGGATGGGDDDLEQARLDIIESIAKGEADESALTDFDRLTGGEQGVDPLDAFFEEQAQRRRGGGADMMVP